MYGLDLQNKFDNIIHIIKLNENVYVLAQMFKIAGKFLIEHLIKVNFGNTFELIPINNIAEKCILVQTRRQSVTSLFPNRVKRY